MNWFTGRFRSRIARLEHKNKQQEKDIKELQNKVDLLGKSLSVVRNENTKLFNITTKQGNLDRDLIDKMIGVLKELRLNVTGKDKSNGV